LRPTLVLPHFGHFSFLALRSYFLDGIDELESLPAFLTLKFISGHTVLLEFADSLKSQKPCRSGEAP
jgi:hypothetical protein